VHFALRKDDIKIPFADIALAGKVVGLGVK